jgi:hypothetical protein
MMVCVDQVSTFFHVQLTIHFSYPLGLGHHSGTTIRAASFSEFFSESFLC